MQGLIKQFLKFGVVGGVAFLIDYGVLMLLNVGFGVDSVIAAAISFCISVVFNYVASMRFVFEHRDDLSRKKEFVIFIILSAIGLGLNEICMGAGKVILGETPFMVTVAKLIATAIVSVWNFFSRKKWLDAGSTDSANDSAE